MLRDLLYERIESCIPSFLDNSLVLRSRCGRGVKLLLVDRCKFFSYSAALPRDAELVSRRRLALHQAENVGGLLAVGEVLFG